MPRNIHVPHEYHILLYYEELYNLQYLVPACHANLAAKDFLLFSDGYTSCRSVSRTYLSERSRSRSRSLLVVFRHLLTCFMTVTEKCSGVWQRNAFLVEMILNSVRTLVTLQHDITMTSWVFLSRIVRSTVVFEPITLPRLPEEAIQCWGISSNLFW